METIGFSPGDSQEYDDTKNTFSPAIDGRYLVSGDQVEFVKGLAVISDKDSQSKMVEIECNLYLDIKTLLLAVGHIGCDFGNGPYQLIAQQIKRAQELYAALNTQDKEEAQ